MLDPTYLQNVTKGLETYWYDLETKILCEIAERIKENENHLSATADYLMMQAHVMNVSNDKINKYLSDALDLSVDEVKKIIKESTYMSLMDDNKIFDKAVEEGLMNPYTFNSTNFKKLIEQGVSLTTNEIENICQTTAVTARQKLTKVLNSAYMEVSTGTYSSDRAVENAIKQLANEDLSWIDYESGTHRRLDTVIRTAVRTGVNTTAAKCQEKNLDFLDCNLVETTSHLGARPSHAEWQGEIFYRKTPYKSYRNFYTATGYGTAGGLCGINCRHSFYPFIEGISEPTFEKFDSEENNELYELQQQQRYNERKIRSWKRKKEIKDTCGYDTTREKEKIRYWKERNNKLIASDDRLKHNYSRERIYTSKKTSLDSPNNATQGNKLLKQNEITKKAKEYVKEITSGKYKLDFSNGHPLSTYLNSKLGYDALPQVLPQNEFEKEIDDRQLLYRGVSGATDKNVKEMVDAFKYGRFYAGRGVYGNGTYTDSNIEVAKIYTRNSESGKIMEMYLDKDAKIADYKELFIEYEKTGIPAKMAQFKELKDHEELLNNLGAYASIKGYDAIALNGFQGKTHVLILNRGKVIVKE